MNKLYKEQVQYFARKIEEYKNKDLRIFASSSFQSHSIPMLHIISQIDNSIPIYFLNTGYHFPETLAYRSKISELLGLEVIDVKSPVSQYQQRESDGKMFFASDPSHCCFLNKTLPMEPVLAGHDVWITGVRRDQNANRSNFKFEAKGKNGILRFHPMLEWNGRMIGNYISDFNIPRHPLEAKGYLNIGCAPCTSKYMGGDDTGRGSRWAGMKKTECGLHTDLIVN